MGCLVTGLQTARGNMVGDVSEEVSRGHVEI